MLKSFTDENLIAFLFRDVCEVQKKESYTDLGQITFAPQPLNDPILVKAKLMTEIKRLPHYVPGLNPVEYVWANIRGKELSNIYSDDSPPDGLWSEKRLLQNS